MKNDAAKSGNKWRLNVFDIVIIIIAIAAAALILNSRRSGGGIIAPAPKETVLYTITLDDMQINPNGLIKQGDTLVDKVEKRAIGAVESVTVVPNRASNKDGTTGDYRMFEVPGRWSAVIVVRADATVTESLLSVDGFAIRAGVEVSIQGPLYAGKGYITDVERNGEPDA